MKTAVVTGASSGIGFEVCKGLLEKDFFVIGVASTEEKARLAEEKLKPYSYGGMLKFFCRKSCRRERSQITRSKNKKTS